MARISFARVDDPSRTNRQLRLRHRRAPAVRAHNVIFNKVTHTGAVGGNTWSEPQVTGSVLSAGTGMPTPNNAVGWSYKALAAGTTQISSSRPNCPPASPGTVTCHALLAFQLRVEVD